MTRYRTKPREVDAIQFDGTRECGQKIVHWVDSLPDFPTLVPPGTVKLRKSAFQDRWMLSVQTRDGLVGAGRGTWIIRRAEGDLYTSRSAVFEADWEAVENTAPTELDLHDPETANAVADAIVRYRGGGYVPLSERYPWEFPHRGTATQKEFKPMNDRIDWSKETLGTRIRYYLLRAQYHLLAALHGREEADRRSAKAAHLLGLDRGRDDRT